MTSFWFYLLLPILPLFGGLLGYLISNRSAIIATSSTFGSSLLALIGYVSFVEPLVFSTEWIPGIEASIRIDKASLLLICLVAFISFLVQLFSLEYMKEDPGNNRYSSKLGFFVFSMIGLLMAENLLLLFVFWELVGFSSYLLIGFWYKKEGVSSSARVAFMVNRVADAALLAGILLLYTETKNLSILAQPEDFSLLTSLLIAIGAFGKSAQIPFSGWLTKAMVGPTPVSALIHAATMVAAGVYLLFRVAPFLHPDALVIITVIGTLTAVYGAVSAITQFDIKKILAYSTISQLGYMIMGIGVGAAEASLFHLFTHAFFKAGLFLGAASVIHYLHKIHVHDAQDIRIMGGLKHRIPWTYRSVLVCGFALAGLPFFSGFMSKDGIFLASWEFASEMGTWAYLIPDLGLITALLTAFYVGRMILLVFWGRERFLDAVTVKESKVFVVPLIILSLFSFWIFHDWNPLSHQGWILSILDIDTLHKNAGSLMPFLSILLALSGMVLAYSFFKPGTEYANKVSRIGEPVSKSGRLVFHGFYLTQLYEQIGVVSQVTSEKLALIDRKLIDPMIHLFSVSAIVFSKALALVDRFIVDGTVNFVAYFSAFIGRRFAGLSSRDGQSQLGWLLLMVILILIYILFF